MSIDTLLNHTCDIYHITDDAKSLGYGLPDNPEYSYLVVPDEVAVPCHFGIRGSNLSIVQGEPAIELTAKVKLTFLPNVDIRLHDKIVDCKTKIEYTAEVPRDVRGDHKFVYLQRGKEGRAL